MSEYIRQNFSPLEKVALEKCMEKYKVIIESKLTNAVANKAKRNAWKSIAVEFNKIPGVSTRSAKQLRNCYKNLKKRAKQQKADESVEVFRTGSSPGHSYRKQTSFYEVFSDSEATVDDLEKNNLEDVASENEEISFSSETMAPVYTPPTIHVITASSLETKIPTQQPSENHMDAKQIPLLKPQTDKLHTKKLSPETAKLLQKKKLPPGSNIAAAALKKQSDVKTRLLREEHELIMKCKKEEHELQMEILKTQLQIQKKLLTILEEDPQKISLTQIKSLQH